MNNTIQLINKINNFNDIYNVLLNVDEKTKGDVFELLTKYIFILHPYYKQFTQKIWLFNELSEDMKIKFNIPTKDEGIDIVLLSNDNNYYAIQCKFRMNKYTKIQWGELGTFVGLTFGISKSFLKGFFVTNTFYINKNIISSDKIISVYGSFFEELEPNFYNEMKGLLNNIPVVNQIIKTPRYHQTLIYAESIQYFDDHDRGYIEIACGAGKTLTSYWVDKYMYNQFTIIAVPSLYLLSQFYKEWVVQSINENISIQYLLIGSDADVQSDNIYYNNGLIITTDDNDITKFIESHTNQKKVIISTYQSSDKLINVLNKLKIIPEFCIFDEAHKTVGQTNKQFSLLLNDTNLKIKKRLFMTATPKIYNNYNDENDDETEILSMNNEEWYGKRIYLYNTYDAIKNKLLVDYQLMTLFTNNKYIEQTINTNKYVFAETFDTNESHYVGTAIMIMNAYKNNEIKSLVTYHNSIKKTQKFKNILEIINKKLNLNIKILQLDGTASMTKRTKIIKEFVDNDKAIMTSSRVLNEGIDIPKIDSVCFVDPRTSTIDIVQCIGRSLRKHPSKQKAKILVPIICDDINEISNTIYGNLIRIIKSISNTDTGINEYFIKKQEKTIVNRQLIKHINYFDTNFILDNKIDLDEWINAIEFKIWNKVDSFTNMFMQVKQWVDTNDSLPVKSSTNNSEYKLAAWCFRQRTIKKDGMLSNDKIKLLETIKYWYWDLDTLLNNYYSSMKEWFEIHKTPPKKKSTDTEEQKKAKMCRYVKNLNDQGLLDEDKIKHFESLNGWKWKTNYSFDNMYNTLKQFINDNKKYPSQHSNNKYEQKLGRWTRDIKKYYKNNKLTTEQISKLENLQNWKWVQTDIFDTNYKNLINWVNQHNKIPSQHSKDPNEKQFGRLVARFKKDKKIGRLRDDAKIKKLENISGWKWIGNNNKK